MTTTTNNIESFEILRDGYMSFNMKEKQDMPFSGKWESVHGGGFNFIPSRKYTNSAIVWAWKNNIKKY